MEDATWGEYRDRLLRFVRRRVADEHAAEDIVHEVLMRAYQHRDTLRDAASVGAWMYRIARHAVIDHYRARRPSEPIPEELAEGAGDDPRDAARELAACMRPLVERLPGRYREAVTLSELEGHTQAETARRLGLTLSGAKSRVQRGRRLLAAELLRCCSVEVDHRGAITEYQPRGACPPADPCGSCG